MSFVDTVFSKRAFPSDWGEQSRTLVIIPCAAWELPWNTLAKNLIRCNSLPEPKASFGEKRCSAGLCLLYDLLIPFRSPLHMHIFLEVSNILGFHTNSQMGLFYLTPHFPFFIPIFSLLRCLSLSSQSFFHPSVTIYSIFPSQGGTTLCPVP